MECPGVGERGSGLTTYPAQARGRGTDEPITAEIVVRQSAGHSVTPLKL